MARLRGWHLFWMCKSSEADKTPPVHAARFDQSSNRQNPSPNSKSRDSGQSRWVEPVLMMDGTYVYLAASSAIWYLTRHEKNLLDFYTGRVTKEGNEIIAKIGHLMQDTIKTEMSISKKHFTSME